MVGFTVSKRFEINAILLALCCLSASLMPAQSLAQADSANSVLPDPPETSSPDSGIGDQLRFYLSRIEVVGNTVLDPELIRQRLRAYEERYVSIDELHQLRHELSRLYVSEGYLNSGVILPDQAVENGVVRFRAIEGKLAQIRLDGLSHLENDYVLRRLGLKTGTVVKLSDIQNGLKSLRQHRLISQINASLEPGERASDSVLVIRAVEVERHHLTWYADNHGAPSIGAERLGLIYQNYNLNGSGDSLLTDVYASEGSRGIELAYSMELGAENHRVSFSTAHSESEVIEEPFRAIDLESESSSFDVIYLLPLVSRPGFELGFETGLSTRRSEDSVLGFPIAFDPGADQEEGESRGTSLRLGLQSLSRDADAVLSSSLSMVRGLDLFDSTINSADLPDSEYTLLAGRVQYARFIEFLDGRFYFKSSFQFSDEPLLFIDKFVIGGNDSVRGYRENLLLRDNGFTASFEYRVPLKAAASKPGINRFHLVPFIDYGVGEDEDEALNNSEKESISSLGVGFEYSRAEYLLFKLYWAESLDDVDLPENDDLQDDGVHVSIYFNQAF